MLDAGGASDALQPWHQAYGRELAEAYEWCQKYRSSRKEAELHQAWDLYYHVFKRINKQLPQLTVLELQYVAPALVRAQVHFLLLDAIARALCMRHAAPFLLVRS